MQETDTQPPRETDTFPGGRGPTPTEADTPAPDRTLDLRGVSCPLPPLKTLRALKALRPGQILQVLGTSPIGNHSAPFIAKLLGNQLLRVTPDAGFVRLYYRRK